MHCLRICRICPLGPGPTCSASMSCLTARRACGSLILSVLLYAGALYGCAVLWSGCLLQCSGWLLGCGALCSAFKPASSVRRRHSQRQWRKRHYFAQKLSLTPTVAESRLAMGGENERSVAPAAITRGEEAEVEALALLRRRSHGWSA